MSLSKKKRDKLVAETLQAGFLNEREKDILKLRLGWEGCQPVTLQVIGDKYGITRERVRQIGASIIRKTRKVMPDKGVAADSLFIKSWEPKYLGKQRRIKHKKALIKRNKTVVRNKCEKLAKLIDAFEVRREGKDELKQLFRELRIKYRKNKSLFDQDVEVLIKELRQRYNRLKKVNMSPNPDQIW